MIVVIWHNLFLDNILAVGSRSPDNVKAELYNFVTGSWAVTEDYPFADGSRISDYDMVYVGAKSAYYVIGGQNDDWDRLSTIAMFRNGAWSQAGQLNTARNVSF